MISDGRNYCSQCAEPVPSVGMVDAVKLFFSNYANFSGRARRSEYWMFYLFNLLLCFLLSVLMYLSLEMAAIVSIILGIWCLAIMIPSLALGVRRLHDIGNSGWCILCSLIPAVGSILILVWMCTDSKEDNQWGPNPKYRAISRSVPRPQPSPAHAPSPAPLPAPSIPDKIMETVQPTAAHRLPPPSATPASGFSATLLLCTGPMAGKQIICRTGDRVVLGRSNSANQVLIGYDKVSGTHCRIEGGSSSIKVTDLGSTNGTKVNGQKLSPNVPVTVPHGGIIFLADNNCAFQVRYN